MSGPCTQMPCSTQWAHPPQGKGSGRQAALLRGIHGLVSTHLFDSVLFETNPPPAYHHFAPLCMVPLECIAQLYCSLGYFTAFLCRLLFPSFCG